MTESKSRERNDFREKVMLLFLDKLVLGLVVGITVIFIGSRQNRIENTEALVLGTIQFQSDIYFQSLTVIGENVQELSNVLDDCVAKARVGKDTYTRFRVRKLSLETALRNLEAFHGIVSGESSKEGYQSELEGLESVEALIRNSVGDTLSGEQKELLQSSTASLFALHIATIEDSKQKVVDMIKNDIDAIRQAM